MAPSCPGRTAGIVHSERTGAERKRPGQRLFGIQTWMALPASREESDPAFVHHGADALPGIEAGGMRARLIAGQASGAKLPLAAASETLYADVRLKAGVRTPIDTGYDERAIYTIGGTIEVPGDETEFILLPTKGNTPQRATGGMLYP